MGILWKAVSSETTQNKSQCPILSHVNVILLNLSKFMPKMGLVFTKLAVKLTGSRETR